MGQNAISILLQPPIVRTAPQHGHPPTSITYKPPSARDIPPVTLTSTAHVDPEEFKPYLVQFGAVYEQLRTLKGGEDEVADILRKRSGRTDEFAVVLHDGSLRPSATRKSSIPSSYQGRSSELAEQTTQGLSPPTAVPVVYFDADFHLENPRTFDLVTERCEVVTPKPETLDEKKAIANTNSSPPRKALATNAILQEKLSWYIDTVEMHLVASISSASTSFFAALSSLRELHTEVADSVKKIKALSNELDVLDQEIAVSGLYMAQRRQRWENLQKLHDAILQLQHIVDNVAACESLIDDGNIGKASDSIASLEKLICCEPGFSKPPCRMDGQIVQLRDIRDAVALQGVHGDLATLRLRIGKAYETQFLNLLLGDLRRHSTAVSKQEVLIRWTSAFVRPRGAGTQEQPAVPSYLSSTDHLRTGLLETSTNLYRTKHLMGAASAYRKAILKEIRNHATQPPPSANDENNESMAASVSTMTGGTRPLQQKSSILDRDLQALEPGDAEVMLAGIYVNVAETLRRLTTQVKLLLDITSSLDSDSSIAARHVQELYKAIDLPRLLGQAVDIAQNRIVERLRIRSEQCTRLSRVRFLRYFSLNLGFVSECESISGKSGTALKMVVNEQIKDFIQQHGKVERQTLTQGMESDRWEAGDFTEDDSAELNWILSCNTTDPTEQPDSLNIWIPYFDGRPEPGETGDSQTSDGRKAKIRSAYIGEQAFVLPNSAIICMRGLSHFLQLISGMPSMAADISSSLVSYLRRFGACCTRLVLEAGARQSAGLRNITSKHLALASQSLAFIATLMSHVRGFVQRYAGRGATPMRVVEFDEVKRLYQEQESRMRGKLVDIISRLAQSHVKALKDIDWDNGQKDVHPYMATLVKDTTSLHRTLTKTMPKETVITVMARVFLSYKAQFGQALQEMGPMTEPGRHSLLLDFEFFISQLGMMEGFADAGEYLTAIVQTRPLEPAALAASASDAETEGKEAEKNANAERGGTGSQ